MFKIQMGTFTFMRIALIGTTMGIMLIQQEILHHLTTRIGI